MSCQAVDSCYSYWSHPEMGMGMGRWDGMAPNHDNLHHMFKRILTCCLERRPESRTRETRWFRLSSPGCRWSRLTWNDPPVMWELALPVFFCWGNQLRRRQWGDRCSLGGNRGWQERTLGSGQDGRAWLRVKDSKISLPQQKILNYFDQIRWSGEKPSV